MPISKTTVTTLMFCSVGVLPSCSTSSRQPPGPSHPTVLSNTSATARGVIITDEMIGRSRGVMRLTKRATDAEYGYSEKSPIKVGGGFGSGSERTYQFLNALRGPEGQEVKYSRVGTCCPFKSPNSPFDGEALLEVYEIMYAGASKPRNLYFNWYDEAEVLVPSGLTSFS